MFTNCCFLFISFSENFTSVLANISEFGNFNPHGFAQRTDGLLTIANYILPASLLAPSAADLVFRDSVVTVNKTGHIKVLTLLFLFLLFLI